MVFLLHVGRLPLAISRIVSRNRILCEAAFTAAILSAHPVRGASRSQHRADRGVATEAGLIFCHTYDASCGKGFMLIVEAEANL